MAVMGKASVPGRAKTRLIPEIGAENAASLNTAFLQDITANLLLASIEVPISAYVAYGPAGTEHFFRDHLPEPVRLLECSLPDFGDCLFHAIITMLDRGHLAACVVNSDSPTLPTGLFDRCSQTSRASGRSGSPRSVDGRRLLFSGTQSCRTAACSRRSPGARRMLPRKPVVERLSWAWNSSPWNPGTTWTMACRCASSWPSWRNLPSVDRGPVRYAAPNTRAALAAIFEQT